MKKIIAIGGGDIRKKDTLDIDKQVLTLSGVSKPKVLFIPTASEDNLDYCEAFEQLYAKDLGCEVKHLFLLRETPTEEEIKEKIMAADIIYAGDGNGLKMLRKWRFTNTKKWLRAAMEKGTVMTGINAGALCWFDYGHSNSMEYYLEDSAREDWHFIRIKSLRLIDKITCCPQFNEADRQEDFKQMIRKKGGIGLGLDKFSAIEIVGDEYRIHSIKKDASAYKLFKNRTSIIERKLATKKTYTPFYELLGYN